MLWYTALAKGTSSSLVEFQVGVDEAVARFDSFQASSCRCGTAALLLLHLWERMISGSCMER